MKRFFYGALFVTLIGNLVRIPLMGDTSILLADILLPVLVVFGFFLMVQRKQRLIQSPITWPIFLLLLIMLASLVYGTILWGLGIKEVIVSFLYLIRYLEYAALFLLFPLAFSTQDERKKIFDVSIWVGLGITALGYLQYIFIPDFRFMAAQGWDPHIGRLLGTWYDPNFMGGFLAFMCTLLLAQAIVKIQNRNLSHLKDIPWFEIAAMLFMIGALVLTFSRSAYLALIVGFLMVALIRSPYVLLAGALVAIIAASQSPRMQERIQGAIELDETSRLRIQSWIETSQVIAYSPFLGVGYNTLKFVQDDLGTAAAGQHSGSGSESSLITILITTGPLGLLVFMWIYFRTWIENLFVLRHKKQQSNEFTQIISLALFAGIPLWFVHSWFVNDLFYTFIITFIWIYFAIFYAQRNTLEKGE